MTQCSGQEGVMKANIGCNFISYMQHDMKACFVNMFGEDVW